MASIKGKLDDTGRAVLSVIIVPSLAYRQAKGLEEFKAKNSIGIKSSFQFSGRALIDTGASVTSIDRTVAQELNLIPKGQVPVKSVTGENNHNIFDIDLFMGMDNKRILLIEDRFVVASDIKGQGFIALIGTDVLKLGILRFNKGEYFQFEI